MRKRHLPLIAAVGAAVAVLPSIAVSSGGPSVLAQDSLQWAANGTAPARVAVMPGGSVSFSYDGGTGYSQNHYPVFSAAAGGAAPTCDAGVPRTALAPGTAWAGNCTFASAGVYQFYCGVHGTAMSGTVDVNAAGTVPANTTTTTGTTPTTTTTVTPPGGSGASGGSPGSGGSSGTTGTPGLGSGGPVAGTAIAPGSLKLAAAQRGGSVRGSLVAGPGGAQLTIGLELAASQARARTISAGSLSRRAAAGPLSFSVPLNRAGRRALSRHHRLRLTVRIHAVPQGAGTASELVRHVSLRG